MCIERRSLSTLWTARRESFGVAGFAPHRRVFASGLGALPARKFHVAVEACTGWLFVCEALAETGAVAHLAEPVETSALRGKKRRAKTDREDARWLRELLADGRLPEAWIPPAHVLEWRTCTRLRKTLVDERTRWLQRVQAALFHHGISGVPDKLLSAKGREFLAARAARRRASGSRCRFR
jgi:transposase